MSAPSERLRRRGACGMALNAKNPAADNARGFSGFRVGVPAHELLRGKWPIIPVPSTLPKHPAAAQIGAFCLIAEAARKLEFGGRTKYEGIAPSARGCCSAWLPRVRQKWEQRSNEVKGQPDGLDRQVRCAKADCRTRLRPNQQQSQPPGWDSVSAHHPNRHSRETLI